MNGSLFRVSFFVGIAFVFVGGFFAGTVRLGFCVAGALAGLVVERQEARVLSWWERLRGAVLDRRHS